MINSDDYYGPHGFQEIYNYLVSHPDRDDCYEYAMVGYLLQNTVTEHGHVARGVCQETEDGYLHSVVELTRIVKGEICPQYTEDGGATWQDLSGDTVVSMNLWGFTRSYLGQVSRFSGSGLEDGSPESRVLPACCGQPAPGLRKSPGENSSKPRQVVRRHLSGG